MLRQRTYKSLPGSLARRSFSLQEAAAAWDVDAKVAWKRLRALTKRGLARRLRRGVYAPTAARLANTSLPDTAERVLSALGDFRSYRLAMSGVDVLVPYLHNLPARYPHLLLLETRAIDDVQRALGHAGFLAVDQRTLPGVWKAEAPIGTVLLKSTANWHGVPTREKRASTERGFLDLLVATRAGAPYSSADVSRMWDDFDSRLRDRVARLGRNLQIRPFYDRRMSRPLVPTRVSADPIP